MNLPSVTGDLTFGHIIDAAGIDPAEVLVVRHTYNEGHLETEADLTPEKIFAYTHEQRIVGKFPAKPPRIWLVFMADGARRSRLLVAYENHGEMLDRRDEAANSRSYNLKPSEVLSSLVSRLVIEWPKDTVNWAKTGAAASKFKVVEIADPEAVPFPGFDQVLVTHGELRNVVGDSRYKTWQTALSSVQGVYLITDTSPDAPNGRHYVGKADGKDRLLGRWTSYANDGHGGNKHLLEAAGLDPDRARNYQFSILRVFGPHAPKADIDDAEAHYKRALLSVKYGLNGG